mgnify:CR=1 FL=1
MKFIELVEKRKKEVRKENLKLVREEINNNWVQEKILSYCERQGDDFSKAEVEKQILDNDIVASFFAKDPSKQNITEKLVEEILKIEKLPAVGKNCVRFTQDGTITNKVGVDVSKSADFKDGEFYYTQKYTHEGGGAQDNQYNDVVDFLIKGSKKNKVGAILDGEYWENKRTELEEYFQANPNVRITSVDRFRGEMIED